ncbi:putative ribonuclease H-like domain-containing protein [Tanacetum coccineum]
MVPRTVLTRSSPISLNAARPDNTVQPRTTVNNAGPMKNVINNAYSTARRPFNKITAGNNINFNKRVNIVNDKNVNAARPNEIVKTARPKAVLSAVKGNKGNAVKASACWVWRLKHKVLVYVSRNNGASMAIYNYKEINGGFVAFGGNSKGGKITGKGKITTGKLDFEDVYFVKELKFNLFSVSQKCDKKNSVLFTDTACVVLSPNFKLTDESHVLLKVPRKDNMLGHVNFKTMNKLVKGNLVRGLPIKLFKINQTCVACQKGKQHRASCKSKTVSSISQPLQMLHMDLFGPTFVKSLMKKMYCLVVTDDFSRFSWVFFLATKDETFEILKTFITGIENLIDLRVKVIRCDNETEFKNRVMNQFCEMKGIKREFSVARTPQQNGVAERKNRTLIEAARTMLADSKLPTTFWAEAVNTACYVQNRVLVIKPHNKTPYELFLGRKPALSFMRPFGCPVTILNTIDHLGKARMETIPGKDYILLPLSIQDLPFSSSSKDSPNAGFKPSGEEKKKDTEDPGNKSGNPTKGRDSEGEYDMWKLRIKQYFQVQDYALWDVIENGNSFKPAAQTITNADGSSTTLIPGLYKDAKTLFAAIQTRFGSNDAIKKTQKTLLKNKPDLNTMSFDDLYNNFKIVEQEVKGTANSSSSSSSQNMDFVSSPSSTNEVNTAYEVNTANTKVSLASTQCKKQIVVANSITEAEYVAASSCYGQVLWIQNQLLDYGDSNEKKLIQMIKIHTDKNVIDLLTKAFDVSRFQYLIAIIRNAQSLKFLARKNINDRVGIGVNASDSKLMMLGINLPLLDKVNAAMHTLQLLVVS